MQLWQGRYNISRHPLYLLWLRSFCCFSLQANEVSLSLKQRQEFTEIIGVQHIWVSSPFAKCLLQAAKMIKS